MKKVLVVSDSHGDNSQLYHLLNEFKNEVDCLVHCGDFEYPTNELRNMADRVKLPVYAARGNCDYCFTERDDEPVFEMEGHVCIVVHGHRQGVNWGDSELVEYAQSMGADIAFYGHTHVPAYQEYKEEGVTVMNPGSVTQPRQMNPQRTFLIVDFLDDGTVEPHFYAV